MQSHPFDILQLETGAFIFTPCPGTKGVGLSQSVADLKAAGAKAIITLMYDEELVKNGAQQLVIECEQAGLSWFQLPILDDDAPKPLMPTLIAIVKLLLFENCRKMNVVLGYATI